MKWIKSCLHTEKSLILGYLPFSISLYPFSPFLSCGNCIIYSWLCRLNLVPWAFFNRIAKKIKTSYIISFFHFLTGWDSSYNPWGTGNLTSNTSEATNENPEKEDGESSKKVKSHLSKKEKKQLDKLEAIAIERAEQRVVEGTYLKLSFLNCQLFSLCTSPRPWEMSMKNCRAKVKPVLTPHLWYKAMLKLWRKLW